MKVDVYEEKLVSSLNSEDQSKPWRDPSLMGEAKILVEVKQDKSFPRKLALKIRVVLCQW
ncbi:unnamed protein product [Brassica napus]|uniref:(rape) hypothetical protein n=1 Tax=Brassica napus TaxID=3708 RepID=A0A816JSH4_BRANA|nr:unnamed protein product [Brassica napus]